MAGSRLGPRENESERNLGSAPRLLAVCVVHGRVACCYAGLCQGRCPKAHSTGAAQHPTPHPRPRQSTRKAKQSKARRKRKKKAHKQEESSRGREEATFGSVASLRSSPPWWRASLLLLLRAVQRRTSRASIGSRQGGSRVLDAGSGLSSEKPQEPTERRNETKRNETHCLRPAEESES